MNSVLFSLFLLAIDSGEETAGQFGLLVLKFHAWEDSWGPMYKAIQHLREHPDIPVYSELFFRQKIKFQYPLSSLLPLDLLQASAKLSREMLFLVLNALSWGCLALSGLVSWLILRESNRSAGAGSRIGLLTLVPVLAVTITFYPLARSFVLGQIQTAITLFVALAILSWQLNKPWIAGVLLGACCAIKPQWGVVILWGLVRKEWKFALAAGVTFGVLSLAAIGRYGFQNVVDYLPVVSFLSRHGESFYPNQSINGLLNRILFNGDNLNWHPDAFPPFHPLVYAGTLISTAVIVAFALFWRRDEKANAFDLSILVLSITMASPIAWEHHYGILLPIFALITPVCLSGRAAGKLAIPFVMLAFVLTSQMVGLTRIFAETWANVLQSYLFFGAVLVLWLLYRNRGFVPEASSTG